MSMKLFYNDMSPPVRAVLMTAAALDVQLQTHEVHIYGKDQRDPELLQVSIPTPRLRSFARIFALLQINPRHTVPTLVDGDFTIWDSHAIVGYLVGLGESDELHPKDTKLRALVDQFLYFDSGVLYPRVNTII
ncbi:GST N 3 domain containing protein, partial [Asbolus verrucosus]